MYPLGGVSKFFLPLNASYLKEFLILLSGPIAQELAKNILLIILPADKALILIYHYGILAFNLMPIYPLDGGKLTHLFLSMFLPYRTSLKLSIYVSYITITILLILNIPSLKLNSMIMIVFLIYKTYSEQVKVNYVYEKFVLERYLNNYTFKFSKLINNYHHFYKGKGHIIKENNKYFLEQEYLSKKYEKN